MEQKGWEDIYCTRDGTETELRVGDLPNAVCYANCRCGKLELDMGYWFRLEVEDRPGIRRPPPGAAIESQSSKSVGSLVPDSEIQFDYNEELNLFVRINRAVTPCDSHGSRTPLKSQFTKTSAARGTPRGPDDRSQFQKQQQSYFYVRLMQSISSGHYAGQLHDLYEDLLENVRFSKRLSCVTSR
ncbi:MAG: hypothetical protein P4M11_07760 [Candidatus Pacebacteria bacterium]|nr:hypothetical protein [Candidatus Paceibacterota bacterium]